MMALQLGSQWFSANWGNLASVVGLAVSTATLFVAKWAKKAAEEAKNRGAQTKSG